MSILRRVMIEERNRLVGREKRSLAIKDSFLSAFSGARRVFLYVSFGSEVETHELILSLLSQGKEVFAPKMFGINMKFFRLTSLDELVKSPKGIPEPKGDGEEVLPTLSDEDIMILPGVMFDEVGGRVGYGMGCYDRYLAAYPVHTVAFAYEMQVDDEPLNLKPSDKKYEALITEKRLIRVSQ